MLLLHKLQKKVVDLTTKSFTMKKQATSNKQQATLKIRFKSLLFPLFFYMLIPLFSKSQIISNLVWNHVDGISEPYSITKSLTDKQGNTITIATKVEPSEDANISVIKFDRAGSIIWQQSYNGISNAKDYATNLYIDDDYNIFVCGTSYDSTTLYDMLVLKYDSAGTLEITMQYDGPANGDDIATAVGLDGGGRIYVTGSSTVSGNMTDFVTVKYQTDGTFDWEAFYDYANGYEVPIGIEFKHDYSSMYISGASASSLTNWDYATINYDLSGTQLGAVRSSSAGIGFDNPMGFFIDSLNNIYITGSAIDSGTATYNIKTMKLDSALNILWTKTYDEDHMNDQGNDLAVDDYGNVYVTGYVMAGNDSSNIAILKYDAAGNLIWNKNYGDRDTFSSDKGKKIVIVDNKIFVTGTYEQAGNLNISTFQIDSSGNMMWCKFFDGVGHGFDSPTSLTVTDSNEVIISGISFDGIANTNITYNYSLLRIDSLVVGYNTDSNKYVKGEVIVKFDPAIIDSNFADNINWQFAKLSEIVPNSVVTDIVNAMSYDPAGDLIVVKIYDWMTKSDSLSIARNGDTIVMDKLWSTYRLLTPYGYDEEDIDTALNNGLSDIKYAQLNYIFSPGSIPNDTYISNQLSLIPSLATPDAHIHADGAWDIETGSSLIKVGIIDGIIDYTHPDFGGGSLATSKIIGGEDFVTNTPIDFVTTYNWHGTACGGIIGALRNNGLGIAGVAGGDIALNNKGVSLVTLGVQITPEDISLTAVINAIVKGSAYTLGNSGYACNILNNSYEKETTDFATQDAVKFCFDNHCTFVGIRGNRYSYENFANNTKNAYPGCNRKEWVINVGASGNNGFHKQLSPGSINGDLHFESNYGSDVDVIAPGSMDIITSCQATNTTSGGGFADGPFAGDIQYTHFNGTSAAAPHVTGLSALMLSHHKISSGYPNSLDDGDIQYLIKKYATDNGTEGQTIVGSGLINAEETMKHIDISHGYWVQHVNSMHLTGSSVSTINTGIPISLNGFYSNELTPNIIYTGNQIYMTRYYTATLPGFAVNPQVEDHWITHKSGAGSNPVSLPTDYYEDMTYSISGNVLTATVKTYCYEITSSPTQIIYPYKYFPDKPNDISTDVSFLMYDNTANLHSVDLNDRQNLLNVFPNPCNKNFYIEFLSDNSKKAIIKVYNTLGQIVINYIVATTSPNRISINTSDLPNGIYQVMIETSDNKYSTKLIVQH